MPRPEAARYAAVGNPYPGLRPFDLDDAHLFFGREEHTQELLDRLTRNRFLAVVGSSGSGKSSLVRAGLLPALYRGYLIGATTRWRVAVMRPGNNPLEQLAAALSAKTALAVPRESIREPLAASSLGLVSVVASAGLAPRESLLLVVDQFEELFTFARESSAEDAHGDGLLFVSSLLEAVDQFEVPIYVVLTMRTDFLGHCSAFPALPEALNRSQYLVPRLTREQRRDAIERPVEIANAEITPRAVQEILNDTGDDPDQLPLMQHALARMHRVWSKEGGTQPLDLAEYETAGAVADALNAHAQSVYTGLAPEEMEWARHLFRCLTKLEQGRAVRRPTRLDRILAVVGATDEPSRARVRRVIETFAAPENGLLFLSSGEGDSRVVDISHESLIRKWEQLRQWAREEAESAEWYSDLARDVRRKAEGKADLWTGPAVSRAGECRVRDRWNEAWARQYAAAGDPSFAQVEDFLARSVRKEHRRRRNRYLAFGGIGVLIALSLFAFEKNLDLKAARAQREAADNARHAAEAARAASEIQLHDAQQRVTTATNEADRKKAEAAYIQQYDELVHKLQTENATLMKQVTASQPGQSDLLWKQRYDQLNGQISALTQELSVLRPLKQQNDDLLSRVKAAESALQAIKKDGRQLETPPVRQQPVEQKEGAKADPPAEKPRLTVEQIAAAIRPAVLDKAIRVHLENDSAAYAPGTNVFLVLKHMGAKPEADLYAVSGPGKRAETEYRADKEAQQKEIGSLQQSVTSCNGERFPLREGAGAFGQCFKVVGRQIKSDRPQSLGTIIDGGRVLHLVAIELSSPFLKEPSITVELR